MITFMFIHFLFSFWIIASPEVYGSSYSAIIALPLAGTGGYLNGIIKRLSTMAGLVLAVMAFVVLFLLIWR